ncbi:MAG: hypothetical protein JNK87_05925 [Bryobacterales bacterium]|nr:hypothetical protein [Bryobacterales bacterium]
MNALPKAVIEDLLPLYAAGEASPETAALLEQELTHYPDLRDQVQALRAITSASVTAPEPDLELRAVAETNRLLSRRTWALAVALFTSFLPSSFQIHSTKMTFIMARDQPLLACGSLVIAYCAWLVYFQARRRLSVTGLQAPATPWNRLFWTGLGFSLGAHLALVLGYATTPHWALGVLSLLSAALFFHQSRPE